MRRQSVGGGTYVDENEERQRDEDYGYGSQRPAAIPEGVEQNQVRHASQSHLVVWNSTNLVLKAAAHMHCSKCQLWCRL